MATDLFGPLVVSMWGPRYLQLWKKLVDRDCAPTFCKTKSSKETLANYRVYCKYRPTPVSVLADNGAEFQGEFSTNISNAYRSPEHLAHFNGGLEVEYRVAIQGVAVIILAARALLGQNSDEAALLVKYWPEAAKYFCCAIGRLPRSCK